MVEIDESSIRLGPITGIAFYGADVVNVISIDGNSQIEDLSQEEFPDNYYRANLRGYDENQKNSVEEAIRTNASTGSLIKDTAIEILKDRGYHFAKFDYAEVIPVKRISDEVSPIELKGRYDIIHDQYPGIILDEPVIVDGDSYNQIFFEGALDIINYVPREFLTYNSTTGVTIISDYDNPINIVVQVDQNFPIKFSHMMKESCALEMTNLVEVEGNSELIDLSNEGYTEAFYSEVVRALTRDLSIDLGSYIESKEPTESQLLNEALDKLSQIGYTFKRGEGYYNPVKIITENSIVIRDGRYSYCRENILLFILSRALL